ncbi:MAG: iron ABC transporter permease [Oscillospiraceae bacterium]|jgi:iron complex transport system permease protein|nr:iron ABC transporter permease [Oscillospiraceae bacterium]
MEQKKLRGYSLIILALGALLLAVILASFVVGRYPMTLPQIFASVRARIDARLYGGDGVSGNPTVDALFFNVRLPRVFLSCMVGCCLSAAGAAYQGVFQNPMASPDILGASSGAAAGAALAILLGLSGRMVTVFAFGASLLIIGLVMLVSRTARGNRLLRIILAGIMVSSLCNAATSFIKLVADPNDVLPEITYWLMGSLAKTKPDDVLFALIPMAIGLIPLLLLRWRINLLTLSDREARAMGVNVAAVRVAVIVCATLVTAASVSVSGLIGWVGLVVPHLARRLVGSNYRHLIPASMLGGALFLLIVDNLSRNLLLTEIPIGILTSVIGAPFFLWMITRKSETV